jgi:hypothetical protein
VPSGDQEGRSPAASLRSPDPSALTIEMLQEKSRVGHDAKAIVRPSGDQAGFVPAATRRTSDPSAVAT